MPTELRGVHHDGGEVAGYVVQPLIPAETLVPWVLAAADPERGHPAVAAIVEAAADAVGPRLGIDAQAANWSWSPRGLRYMDVSTPMLWSNRDEPLLDLELISKAFPAILRVPLRRWVAPRILDAYRDLRGVYLDLTGNLIKERLERWLPAFLVEINRGLAEPPLDAKAVRRYYRSDARLWAMLLGMRRIDRFWMRRVRRRPYPFLLPERIER